MATVRVSLAEQLETRDGTITKDELPTNCFVDGLPNHKYVTKRFGTSLSVALGAGTGQGMFHLGSDNYAIKGDSLYRLSDSHNFTYTAPTTSNLQYQSITQPDNTKTIFKNTTNGYIFDGTTVSQIPKNGGISSITMTNNGWGGAVSPPTMTWNTPVTSNITGGWLVTGIAYGNGVYVAVGNAAGGVATTISYSSTDGITWTARTIPSSTWSSVAWNGTVFCAITSNGNIAATSPDGITWTQRTLSASLVWRRLIYANGLFVAIATGSNTAATSPDGITWTSRTLPAILNWSGISWNGTLFCAIAQGTNSTATSPDGINWTARTISTSTNWDSIFWNGTVFCALAYSTSTYATSNDGISWTTRTFPITLGTSTNISAIGTVFCVVSLGSNSAYISNDGVTWVLVSISGATGSWGALSNNGSQFVTIDRSTTALITNSTAGSLQPYGGTFNLIFTGGSGSGAAGTFTVAPGAVSNTIAFTTRTLPASANWSAIAFSSTLGTGSGRFCAIASGGTTAATSDDGGLTWTARTLPATANWCAIAWNGTIFCAIASGGSIAATSSDGITWTQRALPSGMIDSIGRPLPSNWASLAWSGTVFCASYASPSGGNSSLPFITSPDGITWTRRDLNIPSAQFGIFNSIAWNGKLFCAVCYGTPSTPGSILAVTSPDGITWTARSLPTNAYWQSISWSGSLFCAVAYGSNISAISNDGITWTQQTLPTSSQWSSITWNGGLFCVVSNFSGLVVTSPDGATWTQTAASTTESWSSLACNTSTGLIVGVASGTAHAMTGIAGVSSGGVVSTTITNPGSGYSSSAPSVSFANATGLTGATGIANVSSFPTNTVPGIAYLDGTYYVMEAGTNKIYGSGTTNAVLDNPAVWTPLNVIVANSVSGTGVAIARYYNYIVALKSESIEFFYDAGGALPSSPLASVSNSVSRVGCASSTIVPIDNTIVFLSKSIQRGIQVSMLEGQSSVVISTPDIDRILNATNILGNSIYAFAIKIQGHSFYILTLKSSGITLGYDMVTKGWFNITYLTPDVSKSVTSLTSANGIATATVTSHGYSDGDPIVIAGANQTAYNGTFNISYVDANTFTYVVSGSPLSPATGTITSTGYVESYFPVTNYLNNGTLDLLQHETDGDIYSASPSVYQDQGSPINVKIRTKLIDGGSTEKKHISKIEVIGDKVNSIAYVRYTNDDYQTFCGYRPVYLSQTRSMIRRCGSARRRAIDLRHTDNTAFRVESLELDIDKSNE